MKDIYNLYNLYLKKIKFFWQNIPKDVFLNKISIIKKDFVLAHLNKFSIIHYHYK